MKIFIVFILLTIFATGCRYKEGPLISFHSVAKRLQGTWQIIGFTSDGIDSLKYYNDTCGSKMKILFPYDEESRINFDDGKIPFDGNFSLSDNKKIMNVYFGKIPYSPFKVLGPLEGNKKSDWKILKLTSSELKISTDFYERNYRISFKKV